MDLKIADKLQAEQEFGQQQFQQVQYIRADLKNCPAIEEIETDPVINAITKRYLGTNPVHITTRLFWSFADKKASYDHKLNNTQFDYDLDD